MCPINWKLVKLQMEDRQYWRGDYRYWREKAKQWGNRYPEDKKRCMKNAMTRLTWIGALNRELREQFSRGMY